MSCGRLQATARETEARGRVLDLRFGSDPQNRSGPNDQFIENRNNGALLGLMKSDDDKGYPAIAGEARSLTGSIGHGANGERNQYFYLVVPSA